MSYPDEFELEIEAIQEAEIRVLWLEAVRARGWPELEEFAWRGGELCVFSLCVILDEEVEVAEGLLEHFLVDEPDLVEVFEKGEQLSRAECLLAALQQTRQVLSDSFPQHGLVGRGGALRLQNAQRNLRESDQPLRRNARLRA